MHAPVPVHCGNPFRTYRPLYTPFGNLLEIIESPVVISTVQIRLEYSASADFHDDVLIIEPRDGHFDGDYLGILTCGDETNEGDD